MDRILGFDILVPDKAASVFGDESIDFTNDNPFVSKEILNLLRVSRRKLLPSFQPEHFRDRQSRCDDHHVAGFSRVENRPALRSFVRFLR